MVYYIGDTAAPLLQRMQWGDNTIWMCKDTWKGAAGNGGRKRLMKDKIRKVLTVISLAVILLVGLALLLYPAVADYANSVQSNTVIAEYQEKVDELDEDIYASILEQVREHNAYIAENMPYIARLSEERRKIYNELLDLTGTGIMAYIDIPKVNVFLPIYHGTSDSVLSMGIGHFEGSSLPIGGESVNTVLSGHSGLPSAKLFTDLDQLVIGDTFIIRVLNEALVYEVDKIDVVQPRELENLHIIEGMDYCTLTTCTPYGINTHRLAIRAHRIEVPEEERPAYGIDENGGHEQKAGWHLELLIVPAVVIVALILTMVIVTSVRRRKRKKT